MVNQRKAAGQLTWFMAAFFVLWTARATWLYALDESIASPIARTAYATGLKLVLWVLPAAAFAGWLRRANPAKYLGVSVFPSLPQWLWGFAVTVSFLLVVALFELTFGRKSVSLTRLASLPAVLGLLQFVISPLLEEILFRGLVMQELMTLLPTLLANAVTSLLFVGIHLPYWLSHGEPIQAVMTNTFGVFVFSVVACGLYARSSSIWPPTLAHLANNLLSSMLVAGPG